MIIRVNFKSPGGNRAKFCNTFNFAELFVMTFPVLNFWVKYIYYSFKLNYNSQETFTKLQNHLHRKWELIYMEADAKYKYGA